MEIQNDNPLQPTAGGPPTVSGQAPVMAPVGQAGPEQGETPEKFKAQAHQLVTRGIELLHAPQTRDDIVAALKNSPNPVEGIANQAKAIIQKVDSISRKEGIELDLQAEMFGGKDLVAEIAEIAEAATGIVIDEDDRQLAFSVSVQNYLKEEIAAGRVDPEELKAGAQQALSQMPKEGQEAANNEMLKIDATAERLKSGQGQQPAVEVVE